MVTRSMVTQLQQAAQRQCGTASLRRQRHGARAPARPAMISAAAAAGPKAGLSIHIAETTVSFPLKEEEARKLSDALGRAMQTFAEKQKAERPQRWATLEYTFKGDPSQNEIEFLEVFCNPNAHATAFDAKALITLRTADGLRVTTEGKLTGIKANVEEYLSQLG